jgi:hypothetical protein
MCCECVANVLRMCLLNVFANAFANVLLMCCEAGVQPHANVLQMCCKGVAYVLLMCLLMCC